MPSLRKMKWAGFPQGNRYFPVCRGADDSITFTSCNQRKKSGCCVLSSDAPRIRSLSSPLLLSFTPRLRTSKRNSLNLPTPMPRLALPSPADPRQPKAKLLSSGDHVRFREWPKGKPVCERREPYDTLLVIALGEPHRCFRTPCHHPNFESRARGGPFACWSRTIVRKCG